MKLPGLDLVDADEMAEDQREDCRDANLGAYTGNGREPAIHYPSFVAAKTCIGN